MEALKAAQEWRTQNGYIDRGGVVVVFERLAQGWVNELRNPETWRPGCVAVDENGNSWIAVGGTDQEGASTWMPRDKRSWKMRTRIPNRSNGGML